jgi:tetratricopeptide (TPR) repeat protein
LALAEVLCAQDRLADAIALLRQALAPTPGNQIIRQRLVWMLVDAGDAALADHAPIPAEAQYRAALTMSPNTVPILGNLGIALAAQHRLSEALATHEAALRLEPENANLGYAYGLALLSADGRRKLSPGTDAAAVWTGCGTITIGTSTCRNGNPARKSPSDGCC